MLESSCLACRYWQAEKSETADRLVHGECRKSQRVYNQLLGRVWPLTKPNDWCGEFAAETRKAAAAV